MIEGLRLRTDTSDPDEARTQLSCAYCPHSLTVGGSLSAFRARPAQGGANVLSVNAISFGLITARFDPLTFDDFVLVSQQIGGRFVARAPGGERLIFPREARG